MYYSNPRKVSGSDEESPVLEDVRGLLIRKRPIDDETIMEVYVIPINGDYRLPGRVKREDEEIIDFMKKVFRPHGFDVKKIGKAWGPYSYVDFKKDEERTVKKTYIEITGFEEIPVKTRKKKRKRWINYDDVMGVIKHYEELKI